MRSHFLGLLFLALASAPPAPAATPEQEYLAARDRHSARLEKLEAAKGGEDAVRVEYDKALADLDARLQKIVGSLSVPGYPARGKISLESLTAGDIGSGMLDALRFQQGNGGAAITVTTDGLLEKWLADWRRKEAKAPTKDEEALRSELFYTSSVGSDAAFTRDAVLDIPKPAGVEFALVPLATPQTRYVLIRLGLVACDVVGAGRRGDYDAPLLGATVAYNLGLGYEWQLADTPWRLNATFDGLRSIANRAGVAYYGLGLTAGVVYTF